MADSRQWLEHLSASLKASRQLAYLYDAHSDTYEFMGDIWGVLGCEENTAPLSKNDFSKLIKAEDVVTRQLTLADMQAKSLSGEKTFTLRYRITKPDGHTMPVTETGIIRCDAKTKETTIQSILMIDAESIERAKKMTRKMEFRETISSSFSGNKSRSHLIDKLDEMLSTADKDMEAGYLLLVGADRMSLVNEVYGGNFADELLDQTEKRLKTFIDSNGELVRVAGDVFALFLPRESQGLMNETAQKILKLFYDHPMLIQEKLVHQLVSIGGVRFEELSIAASSLLGRAELALNDAKRKGRGCFIEYSERLGKEVKSFKDAMSIGDNFLKNFRDGRVKMAYQNIVNSRTNDVSFYECLIRMIDENGEVHSAGRFIEAVEKMGLSRLVDTFATKEAIREIKEFPQITLSVNVSNHTLMDPDWLKAVSMELRDYPEVATRLIVEITESVAMNDVNQSLRVIRALQDLGCQVALDDFGVGQTAFAQLKDLSLDIVKIDKSFVKDMDKEENILFIRTLHSLASAMNMKTVGEGAETVAAADSLARDGIDFIQGYVHGLPSMDRQWASKK